MYPEDYVSELHSLQGRYLHDVGGDAKPGMLMTTPVVTYRSTLTGKRNNIRGSLRKFMAARAEDPDSCVWETGEKQWRIYGTDPVYSISDKTFLLVLTGKGTIKEIQDVLKVVSLMLERKNPSKALYDCTTLRQFVDENVGHDCNGLVFSYFRGVHGLAKTEDKKCYKYRDWERERKSHLDVRELDLVFPSDGGHILIIGRICQRVEIVGLGRPAIASLPREAQDQRQVGAAIPGQDGAPARDGYDLFVLRHTRIGAFWRRSVRFR